MISIRHPLISKKSFFALLMLALAVFLASVFPTHASVTVYSEPSHGYQWEPVATDARVNGGIYSWNTVRSDWQSAHRACALIDPTSYATSMTTGKFRSPKNNTIIWWDGSIWHLASAKTYNSYIQGLTCATDALPDPSLSVSPSSIKKGEMATLVWDAGPYADTRQVQCTATNFSVGTTIPGYMSTQWVCGEWWGCIEIPAWVPDQYVEQRSGSASVSPPQTTTYTYTCTNPNGTVSRTATLTVGDSQTEDDTQTDDNSSGATNSGSSSGGNGNSGNSPQCSDGIDNNGNGFIDYPKDPTCASANDNNEEVIPDPSISLVPTTSVVQPHSSVGLNWKAEYVIADSCALKGDNGDSWSLSGPNGILNSRPLSGETKFTLSCLAQKDKKEVSVSVIVRILPSFKEI